jgi:hypothetical protein
MGCRPLADHRRPRLSTRLRWRDGIGPIRSTAMSVSSRERGGSDTTEECPMRASRLVVVVVLALVGLLWIGQGMGLIGGSAMTGSGFWAVVGVPLLAIAVVLVLWERRRTPVR